MQKEVSDKLYEKFENLKDEIYSEYTLSNASEAPTEESYLRNNLDTLRKRCSKFRSMSKEIVDTENQDKRAQLKLVLSLAITLAFIWLGLVFQNSSPTAIGFIIGATLVIELAMILIFLRRERPFTFLNPRNTRRLFRLSREVENDARLKFRKSIGQ